MYTLGIDTTFHTSGLALVDKDNKVKFNKSIEIDFSDQEANKFFNSHIKNLMTLFLMLNDKLWDKIDLISVINEEGAFHSIPVGVAMACVLSQVRNKNIVGVNHEIAHLYSSWLERSQEGFKFPIVTLSISGAHSAIYYQKSHKQIEKLTSVLWNVQEDSFQGIAALFDEFCRKLGFKIQTIGNGGIVLFNLAQKGKELDFPELNKIKAKYKKKIMTIFAVKEAIEEICLNYQKMLSEKEFQQNLSLNFLNHIFKILGQGILKFAKSYKAKEMHLVGGVSANSIFRKIVKDIAFRNGFDFKAPLKNEFCGDNAAMVAVRGKYKSVFLKKQNFISVQPSQWYYKYYCKNIYESYKSK